MLRATLSTLLTCLLFLGTIARSTRILPPASTPQQALALLEHTHLPDSSKWWPNIRRYLFIGNLRANILYPLNIYQGSNTNFCGYAALSYLPLQNDPLAYTRHHLPLRQQHIYQAKRFSIEFTDRSFDRVSLELITDTLTYIYEYNIGETRLHDTLVKYGYDPVPIRWLIGHMQKMNCTRIDRLDYYGDTARLSLSLPLTSASAHLTPSDPQ